MTQWRQKVLKGSIMVYSSGVFDFFPPRNPSTPKTVQTILNPLSGLYN